MPPCADRVNVNSYTGSSHHYCLFDVLHEGNTKKQDERLRRCGLVPQLAGFVNTQVEDSYTVVS